MFCLYNGPGYFDPLPLYVNVCINLPSLATNFVGSLIGTALTTQMDFGED